jgi:hypothetical protein
MAANTCTDGGALRRLSEFRPNARIRSRSRTASVLLAVGDASKRPSRAPVETALFQKPERSVAFGAFGPAQSPNSLDMSL